MRGILLLLIVATLAGCADDGGVVEAEPEAFKEIEATKDTGVVRGVVVDQSITPVVGAEVTLAPVGLDTTTDADGAFFFVDLQPGTYFATATAAFHSEAQSSVEVVAGVDEPDIIKIQLIAQEIPEPYLEELTWKFFQDGAVDVNGNRVVAGGFIGEGTYVKSLEIGGNTTFLQAELVWDYATPLSERMRMIHHVRESGDTLMGQGVTSTTPLISSFGSNPEDVPDLRRADASWHQLWVASTSAAPVGASVAQELNLFLHAFHYFAPPEGWTFGEHGTPTVPEAA